MSNTDDLTALQGHVVKPTPTGGVPTKIWPADVTTVNPDGTVDIQPTTGRASKVNVPVPDTYQPKVGDRVLVTNLLGEPQYPAVLGCLTHAGGVPKVTGSRSSSAALESLLTALAGLGLIVDNTTT